MTAVLSAQGLAKEFRGFRAVDGVDLDVAEGSVHALVGPNGAGKTTLFNLLTGFLRPPRADRAGRRRAVRALARSRSPGSGVARSFQITSLFPQLTAREHVELALQGAHRPGLAVLALGRSCCAASPTGPTSCWPRSGWPTWPTCTAGALAYGRKRALELALALALDPKVLLLDEPTAGHGRWRTSTAPSS